MVSINHLLVSINKGDALKGIFHWDFLSISNETACFDSKLHTLHIFLSFVVEEGLVVVGKLSEVNRVVVEGGLGVEPVAHVLENMLRQERSDGRHELGGIHENIEETVEGNELILLSSVISLHAWTVESHVPVGEILEEVKSGPDNVVEFVALHLVAD
jgi:hypothetical protein